MNMEEETWQRKSFLAGACRTAIGTMGGALSTTPAAELGAIVIKEALNRAGVAPEAVDQVYMGCVIQAGLGQNDGTSGIYQSWFAYRSSGCYHERCMRFRSELVNQAAQMILAGDADIVVAGGMENMSMAPYAIPQGRYGYRMGNATMVDTMVNDALTDAFNPVSYGHHCRKYRRAVGSDQTAAGRVRCMEPAETVAAQEAGKFDDEIVPVEVKKKKETIIFQ